MTDSTDRRSDTTRQQILRAAAHQFAQRPYHDVGLDDILAEAALTKGAMYFHFRSKQALALAVIEEQLAIAGGAVQNLMDRRLSGLETLIDIGYIMAVEDSSRDVARAVLHLLPVVGQAVDLQNRVLASTLETLAAVAQRAVAEGDIIEGRSPHDVAWVLMSSYLGMRQAADLDKPEEFLLQIERNWAILLHGIVPAERVDYFGQFIRRRTALAVKTASTQRDCASMAGRED